MQWWDLEILMWWNCAARQPYLVFCLKFATALFVVFVLVRGASYFLPLLIIAGCYVLGLHLLSYALDKPADGFKFIWCLLYYSCRVVAFLSDGQLLHCLFEEAHWRVIVFPWLLSECIVSLPTFVVSFVGCLFDAMHYIADVKPTWRTNFVKVNVLNSSCKVIDIALITLSKLVFTNWDVVGEQFTLNSCSSLTIQSS